MKSKDCHNSTTLQRRAVAWSAVFVALPASVCWAGPTQTARMWSRAVVVDDQIRLGDLCELAGFDIETHERLRNLVVADAPPPGGSRVIALRQLRELIAGAGVNLAQTIVKGAAECGVSRPRVLAAPPVPASAGEQLKRGPAPPAPASLRDAVQSYFEAELARYGGQVQIDFSRRAAAMLELAGPEFQFDVRRRTGRLVGLIDVEVDVRQEGRAIQTVKLQPIVTLSRRVVVARRAINQKAPIRQEDVQLVEMTFSRLDCLGVTELARVVGQRATKFMPAGTLVELRNLESVPLVKRGQLVDVVSRAGGITVVTTAKALGSGVLGDTVELRSGDRGSRRLAAIVTGPQRVELRGQALACRDGTDRLAELGGR
jgi:flagella basal body P-ring formation protein FlgA